MPNRVGVKEDEVAIDDLQNKVSSEVDRGGSGRTLQRSSQLFWPTDMECSGMSSIEFREGEESLELRVSISRGSFL